MVRTFYLALPSPQEMCTQWGWLSIRVFPLELSWGVVPSEPSSRLDQTSSNIRIYIYLPITKMVDWSHFKNWLQLPIYFGLLSLADFFFTSLQCLVNNLHPSPHPETHTSILWVERTATSHTAAASFSLIASPIPPFSAWWGFGGCGGRARLLPTLVLHILSREL